MKLNTNEVFQGIFILENNYYPGKMIFSHNNPVKILITTTTNNRIFGPNFQGKHIDRVIGSIKETNEKITIVDGFIHESLWSSNNILEYTIVSNLIIFGENIREKIINIPNLHLMFPVLNEYIGNELKKARFNIKEKIVDFSIHFEKIMNEYSSSDSDIKVIIKSFYNIDKYDLRKNFEINQLNSVILEFGKSKELYESIKYVFSIEALFSFIFQKECVVEEICYFKNKKNNSFNHLYFKRNINTDDKYSHNVIFNKIYLVENLSKIIINWIKIIKKIKYLQYYMFNYFQNKYIDQRIVAQVNLIEAFHRYYFGTKKDNGEIIEYINRIVPQISEENDKKYISNILKSKNGYGIERKIYDISTKSRISNLTKKEISTISSIRSTLSHGNVCEDINFDKYLDLSRKLNEIIINIIKKEIE